MKKLKVGLDLDGVVYNFMDDFTKFIGKYHKNLRKDKYNFGLSQKEINNHLEDFAESRPYLWIPMEKKAKKNILRLSNKMDFYIITFRGWAKNGIKDTIDRLREDQISYKEIAFSDNKAFYSRKWGLDYFIEDNLEYAKRISKESNTITLLIDKPYNRQPIKKERIVRVKSLKDII